jgi:hypothetical protein
MNYNDIYSQKWANAAFLEIQSAGLNLDEFRREPWPPSIRIVHLPTKEYFVFGGDSGGTSWTKPGYPGSVIQTGTGSDSLSFGWNSRVPLFKHWLKSLQELLAATGEYHATPDLWSSIRSEGSVFERFAAADLENRPFTLEEQKYIAVQLQELKTFIIRTSQAQESVVNQVGLRLKYLEEAATRMGRKDWLGILIAIVFTVVISGFFAPDRANELMGFTAALFQSLYGFVQQLAPPS